MQRWPKYPPTFSTPRQLSCGHHQQSSSSANRSFGEFFGGLCTLGVLVALSQLVTLTLKLKNMNLCLSMHACIIPSFIRTYRIKHPMACCSSRLTHLCARDCYVHSHSHSHSQQAVRRGRGREWALPSSRSTMSPPRVACLIQP